MRITGGRAAGVRLEAPGRKGSGIRPATDRMREAVFSSLGPLPEGADVLDLFAGTGAYGLEALSRGAASVVWVEEHRQTAALLKRNCGAVLKAMDADSADIRVIVRDLRRAALPSASRFNYIFADPPYESVSEWIQRVFELAGMHLGDQPHDRLLFEMPGNVEIETPGWNETRRFGKKESGPSLRLFARTTVLR